MSRELGVEAVRDEQMVDSLATAMKLKLASARRKGRGGWDDPTECSVIDLHRMMLEHAHKPNLDFVDVANFAGMLQARLQASAEDEQLLAAYVAENAALHARATAAEARAEAAEGLLLKRGRLLLELKMGDQKVSEAEDLFFAGTRIPTGDTYEACVEAWEAQSGLYKQLSDNKKQLDAAALALAEGAT